MQPKYCLSLLSLAVTSLLYGCGGSSSSSVSVPAEPIKPSPELPIVKYTQPNTNISGLSQLNLSLPTGWETSNQSLIKTDLAAVGAPSRISAETANNTYIVQQANAQQASLDSTKKFADSSADNLIKLTQTNYQVPSKLITFTGDSTSELAKVVASDTKIVVTKPLTVDATVNLTGLKNVSIECQDNVQLIGKADYSVMPNYRPDFLANEGLVNKVTAAFTVNNSQYTQIANCQFSNTQAIIASDSQYLHLNNLTVKDAQGYGVIIGRHNQDVIINGSVFNHNYGAGILVMGNNHNVLLANNRIEQGTGYSPWQSGIVITDKKPAKALGETDFLFSNDYLNPVMDKANTDSASSDIYVIKNTIQHNMANGILVDGAHKLFISNNVINQNNRDGVELINTHTTVVNSNEIKTNGWVKAVPAQILNRQFAISFRTETDGGYRLKDSGISLDNVAYNFITNNTLSDNYGSGLHAKRASFYNLIGQNTIDSNNKAKIDNTVILNDGINLNSVPVFQTSNLVSFAPAMGNMIYKNSITGSNQNGIELCIYCEDNEVLENTITSPMVYSIKQYLPREQNLFKDNTSNAKSENTNLNAHGTGGAKAGSVVISDWGSEWQSDVNFKNIVSTQTMLNGVDNLFIGSSTITLWDLNKAFSSSRVANRGFGGSKSYEVKAFLKTLLGNSQPKAIFMYVGDNDIAAGLNVERTTFHLQQNLAYLQMLRPDAQISYIGIKPSPARASAEARFQYINNNIKAYTANHNQRYIDTYGFVKNTDGSINTSLFGADQLHFNEAGYALLSNAVRPYIR